tara:strand:+ start:258 stop:665 length:408 start_codon:yes stop_codon:yes gene_type:complete
MTWLAVKTAFSKVWLWCKHNWKIVALVVYTIVLYLMFSKNTRNAKKMLADARAAHKAEVEALEKAYQEQIEKKDKNLEEYKLALELIELKLKERSEEITEKQKQRVREIVEETKDDPNKLAELIKEEFGFDIWDD